jgi:hypothetical protein
MIDWYHFQFNFSFEFVKATGTEILPVNLPNNQKISGRVLKHLSATGPVYVRAYLDIEVKIIPQIYIKILNHIPRVFRTHIM